MFAGFNQSKMTLAAVLLLALMAGSLHAATMDPLLKGLTRDKAAKVSHGLNYESFLVVDSSENPADPTVAVILHLEGGRPHLSAVPGLVVGSRTSKFATARLPLSSLSWLEADESIAHVEAARLLQPLMDAALVDGRVDEVWAGEPAYTGSGVLVGVIDSGIDWRHADFNDADGDTRIEYIWDMFSTGTPPTGYDYGAEYNATQIDAGTLLEVDYSGHGTHVSGIAAGNGFESAGQYSGVAPHAGILFAKAFDDNLGGFPEDKVIDALFYLKEKAAAMGRPIAINLSLGGHMGPHDGSSAQEQIINDLSGSGVVFCVAAGNEGERLLHDSGPAFGTDLQLQIPTYATNPGSGNDRAIVNVWVDGDASPSVTISLGGNTLITVLSDNFDSVSGTYGSVAVDNATGNPSNGDKQMIIQLDDSDGTAPGAGNWTISINGGSGTAHAWVATSTMLTTFPNSDQTYSVGMPGTSEAAITVAAYKTKNEWLSLAGGRQYGGSWGAAAEGDRAPFSSFGPTRDNREKPDISAPGMGMFAPYSADTSPYPGDDWLSPDSHYFFSQGTSMASPFVCGVAALMLEKNGTLTAEQIKAAMRGSAATDGFTGDGWNVAFGAGKVDAMAAIQAVATAGPPPTGDVNGDETTSVLDLVMLANHIADPIANPLTTEAKAQGDVYPSPSGDGVLNASDLARMVSFILEIEQPGFSAPAMGPVNFQLAQPLWQNGRWWQPVMVQGSGVVAGQFALNLDGAGWQPEDLECDASVQVTAGVAGNQLRVLLYDLGGSFPPEGINLLVPFEFTGNQPAPARTAGVLMVDASGAPLDLVEGNMVPTGYLNVSPNPAPGDMVVSFALQGGRSFELSVFDVRGRRVRQMRHEQGGEGQKSMIFDGHDDSGRLLPAGVYFVRMSGQGQTLSRKIILTR